jgi:NAD(P)-dependent dehydrogenase (short-subunit alcohol dehydrogenase family)
MGREITKALFAAGATVVVPARTHERAVRALAAMEGQSLRNST